MKLVGAVVIFCALAVPNIAVSQPKEFECSKAFPEMPPQYPQLVCQGNDLLERGQVQSALALYQRAATLPFFESPNFLIYFRIATAEAMASENAKAHKTLLQFDDMLSLYIGQKSCADKRNIQPKADSVMCSEVFSSEEYKEDAGRLRRTEIVQEYRERIKFLKDKLRKQ